MKFTVPAIFNCYFTSISDSDGTQSEIITDFEVGQNDYFKSLNF